jgi:hypothetical protein
MLASVMEDVMIDAIKMTLQLVALNKTETSHQALNLLNG